MNKMVDIRDAFVLPLAGDFCDGRFQTLPLRDMPGKGIDLLSTAISNPPLRLVTDAAATPDFLLGGVMLLGNFDGFHRGHQALMAAAKLEARCGVKPLGVMSAEPHPRQLFAPQSGSFRLSTPATKMELFSRLGMEFLYSPRFDHAFAGQEPEQFVEKILVGGLKVSHLVVGRDFRFGRQRRGDVDLLRRMGEYCRFAVTAVEELQRDDVTCSSTLVRNLLSAGDIDAANALLCHPWSVELDLPAEALGKPGEWSVGWNETMLKPACGQYEVAVRRAGQARTLSRGRMTVAPSGVVGLALDASLELEAGAAASLFVDFLARSAE